MIEVLKQAVEAFVVKQYAELESQEPMALPCCGYTDASAVKWNPLNGFVQCHNCGQNYTASQRTWVDLTRTQMQDVYFAVLEKHRGDHQMVGQLAFGEALQAKIKEKNSA